MAPAYVIISGGTGANSIASAFGANPAFVLPVSDDGGSSSEILRCFGGPSIGDIRSRLNRLIPLPQATPGDAVSVLSPEEEEITAIHELMAYRFPADASEKHVKEIWGEIVEGRSSLWDGIGEDKKECIRAFLVHFQTLALRRAHKRFSFRNFSLGNGFLTGARDMFGSLPSAIFLFKSIASVPAGAQVIPVINTNQTVTIAVELENGETIVGQCAVSHPTEPPASVLAAATAGQMDRAGTDDGELGEGYVGGVEDVSGGMDGLGISGAADGIIGHRSAMTGGGSTINRPPARTNSMRLRTHFRRDSRTFDTTPMDTPAVSTRPSLEIAGGRPHLRDLMASPTSPGTGTSIMTAGAPAYNQAERSHDASTYGSRRSGSKRRKDEDEWQGGNIGYVKGKEEVPLEARIERLFYINLYGQEIFPPPNPDFVSSVSKRDCLVYSCGSLWTSIIPCLALRGLASAIATSPTLKARVVLLNSHNDRETPSFKASDYIRTIIAMLGHYDRPRRMDPAVPLRRGSDGTAFASTSASVSANQSQDAQAQVSARPQPCAWEARRLVSHVVYLEGAEVEVDEAYFEEQGIHLLCIPLDVQLQGQTGQSHSPTGGGGKRLFTPEAVEWALGRIMGTTS